MAMRTIAWKTSKAWIEVSRIQSTKELPTPCQLGMAVKSISAPGFFSFVDSLRYLFSRNRAPLPFYFKDIPFNLFALVILGWAVAVSDIWLHLASTSVLKTFSTSTAVTTSYGRTLPSNCTGRSKECSLQIAGTSVWIIGVAEGLLTINNSSVHNAVHVTDEGIAMIVEASPLPSADFSASTFGMQTVCTPISTFCNLGKGESGTITPYDCGSLYPGVSGALGNAQYGFFNLSISDDTARYGTTLNPFNASVGIVVDTATSPDAATSPDDDVEWFTPMEGNSAILLWCEMEFFNIIYTVIGGQTNIAYMSPASALETYPLSGPLAVADGAFGVSSMWQPLWMAAEIDAVAGNSTGFANLLSKDISRIALGMTAGIMIQSPSLSQSLRQNILAARLPIAPL